MIDTHHVDSVGWLLRWKCIWNHWAVIHIASRNVKWLFLAWASQRRWTLPWLLDLFTGLATLSLTLFPQLQVWFLPHFFGLFLTRLAFFCSLFHNRFHLNPISPHILSLDYLIYTYAFNYFLWPNIFQIFISSSDLSLSYRPIFLIDYGCFRMCLGVRKMQIQMRIVLLTNCVTQPNYMTSLSLISTCKIRIISTSNGFCENLIICENA